MENLITIDKELLIIVTTLFLTVAGWLIALFLQERNIRQQLKIEIKYDLYKQLVVLHRENQGSLAQFIAKTISPFIMMDSSMISYDLKLKKEYKGKWICYSEAECVLEGLKKWNFFIGELNNSYFDFSDKYGSILYVIDDWMAPIKNLYKVKEIFILEIDKIAKRVYKNIGILQICSTKKGYNWRKWERKEIEKILNDINNDLMDISTYFHDFMILIHNELLSEYFEYSRPTRKTLDKKYKVLTRKGFAINLEEDEDKIKEYEKK